MKHIYLKSLLSTLLMCVAYSQAFAATTAKIGDLYYELNETTAEVTKSSVSGDLVIPNEVSYSGKTYSVTRIGFGAFIGCTSLTSINIPNSVTLIGHYAFQYCTSLTSINIPNSVTYIGDCAFWGCTGLTSITIPNSVTYIGGKAFFNCTGLTSINIPNSVTCIGSDAFEGCSSLTSINIPNSVTYIGSYAFDGCTHLQSVKIGDGGSSIFSGTFNGCTSLKEVIFEGDHLSSIDLNAFPDIPNLKVYIYSKHVDSITPNRDHVHYNTKFFLPNKTMTLFKFWTYLENNTYDIETNQHLGRPDIKVKQRTQSTLSLEIGPIYDYLSYEYDGKPLTETKYTYTGLKPESWQQHELLVQFYQQSYTASCSCYTVSIEPSVIVVAKSPTTLTLMATYKKGDANVANTIFAINNIEYERDTVEFTGLDPNSTFRAKYSVDIKYGTNNNLSETYTTTREITIPQLSFTTQQPKVINEGNVIVAATTNIKNEEENVGFEWRRTDWTDDFQSNSGKAYLYEGTMEGYIRNLNTNYLWKYRPYYESKNGNRYYGDWIGLDPTNTSYFEPTVHTYAQTDVEGNMARVKGYVQRGTDNVTAQGFKYWKTDNAGVKADMEARHISEAEIPADAMTVVAKGQVMTAQLKDLDYGATYCYVAYAETSEGDTFYGEQQTFKTGADTTPVIAIETDNNTEAAIVARYDMQGRRITKPQRGLNIVRMSDGTTRKEIVK